MRQAALVLLLGLAGCAGLDQRLRAEAGLLAAQTPEAQNAVRAGEILLGFTPALVLLALGEPQRRFSRRSASEELLIWSYVPGSPFFAMPLHTVTVGESPTGIRDDESARVVFRYGRVSAVERRR